MGFFLKMTENMPSLDRQSHQRAVMAPSRTMRPLSTPPSCHHSRCFAADDSYVFSVLVQISVISSSLNLYLYDTR